LVEWSDFVIQATFAKGGYADGALSLSILMDQLQDAEGAQFRGMRGPKTFW
jgi:hypothetical protein